MKQYRYVINGFACGWQNASDTTVYKMDFVAKRLTKWYGDNWYVEYRG